MTDELPEKWGATTLGALCEFVTSGSRGWAKYYADSGATFIRVGNLNRNTIALDLANIQHVAPPPGAEGERTRVAPGDILVSITADVGMVAVVPEGFAQDAYVNQHVALCRLRDPRLSKFVGYALNDPNGLQRAVSEMQYGQTKPGLHLDQVREIPIPLPPLAEQHRIVAKVEALLAEVNAARDRLAKVPAILKRFRQAVLAAACSGRLTEEWRNSRAVASTDERLAELLHARRLLWDSRQQDRATRSRKYPPPFEPNAPDIELPEGWLWVTVSHLALLDVGFAFKSAEFSDSGIRLLRGENVEPGSLRWAETKYWPQDKLTAYRHLLVERGEIILAMDRPLISTGLKIARVKQEDLPSLLVQRVMRFKMADVANSEFLYLCLQQQRFLDFLAHEGMTGSDLPHITGTGVAEFPIPLPPIDEQREIVHRTHELFTLADTVEHQVITAAAHADRITQAILAKAFRGELVPTEAELARQEGRDYEPASTLLERIRREPSTTAERGTRRRRQSARSQV